ncbi:Crp/Fnr family transcriptional regulator [Variovorax sp. J22R133]|uniref:Crp/Fnr family transcriptional regulator n=1 Tax=Variovorax brevis TaxID=3053503 RepID=UPI002574EA61|nr:Crp/Fnr family transcriptional regulator [Variovorax sp. J22R133]MDM0117189.1 Crp/Fnr family transcriptional regulator [Variovorax sp. J22R133]
MQWIEAFGYLGALMTLATFSMKTMLHLRMVGIVTNLAFITYGALGHVYPVMLLHLTLLPLNLWRLWQLLRLTRQIMEASASGLSLEWLKPFSRLKAARAGETLFRQGDDAAEVMFVLGGRFRAVEADVALEQGDFIGELGLINRERKRTQTVVCEQAGSLLLVTYDEVRQMYFQNPKFGFFFLELAAERLMRDATRMAPRPVRPS